MTPVRQTAEQARLLLGASLGHDVESIADEDLAMEKRRPAECGEWSVQNWTDYLGMKVLVPLPLRRWIGSRGRPGAWLYDAAGWVLFAVAWVRAALSAARHRADRPLPSVHRSADRVRVVMSGVPIGRNAATTYGNVIHVGRNPVRPEQLRTLLNHEYVHVLQVRRDGALFLARYLWAGQRAHQRHEHRYWGNYYEKQAHALERHMAANPWLPDVWDLPGGSHAH